MFFKTKLCCNSKPALALISRTATSLTAPKSSAARHLIDKRSWQLMKKRRRGKNSKFIVWGLLVSPEKHRGHIKEGIARSFTRRKGVLKVTVAPSGERSGGGNGSNAKPTNWKTRICNKWELIGYCPFGNKCHFAHGAAELHRYRERLTDAETKDSSCATPTDSKQGGGGMPSKAPSDTVSIPSLPLSDVYHTQRD